MLTWLYFFVRFYLAPLVLAFAEAPVEGGSEGGGFPRWAIILIVVVVGLILLACCAIFILPALLLPLLGPDIGNVFSNIVEELETPQP